MLAWGRVSRLYATDPVGVTDQPEFRNAVVALDAPAGRIRPSGHSRSWPRSRSWNGPPDARCASAGVRRELDLDLLIFGRARISVERPPEARSNDADTDPAKASKLLVVPHQEAHERLFVLAPLADIAPGLAPPGWSETVATARLRREAVEGVDAVRPIATWDDAEGRWTAP